VITIRKTRKLRSSKNLVARTVWGGHSCPPPLI
jgi:hypothetical protein